MTAREFLGTLGIKIERTLKETWLDEELTEDNQPRAEATAKAIEGMFAEIDAEGDE